MKLLRILSLFVVAGVILVPELALAARINEVAETTLLDRAIRFFTFKDPSLRNALLGSMLLGICCGLMGAFLVVRKLSLLGDALSHAVLPGVALGFLWNMSKDPVAIFVGATLVGLLGAGTVQLLRATTRHKEDAALGFVLASFFGVGICLFTMIQNLPGGNKSGLDKFMFGQAAALGRDDVILLAIVTALALCAVLVFYKEYAITSFDAGFARSLGMPVQAFHYSLMLFACLCDCFIASGGRRRPGFRHAGDSGGGSLLAHRSSRDNAYSLGCFRNGFRLGRGVLLVCWSKFANGPFHGPGSSGGFCPWPLFRSAPWDCYSLVAPAFARGSDFSRKHAQGDLPCLGR